MDMLQVYSIISACGVIPNIKTETYRTKPILVHKAGETDCHLAEPGCEIKVL